MKQTPYAPILALLLTAGCGGSPTPAEETPAPTLPESYYLAAAPANPREVAAARAEARNGDELVVVGRVGGSERPFVPGLASFNLVDLGLLTCVDDGSDCATPWDYCCVDPATIARASLTVEFREGAAPLAAETRGFHGLEPLARVVVSGRAERDARDNLIVVASGIHVLGD